jgi:hypothetical protein
MAEFNDDHFEGMFEFFILNGFNDGPRSVRDIQARVKGIERLLDVAAARKGWRGVGSLPVTLENLRREGLLKLEMSGSQEVYSLTEAACSESNMNVDAKIRSFRSLLRKANSMRRSGSS